VSIIIPTYNKAATIQGLLDYLGRATAGKPGLEIIVADGTAPTNTRNPRTSWMKC
jgi:glycosyltransferase involved in cell wall biosynthesis